MKLRETQVYETVDNKFIRVVHLGKNQWGDNVVKVYYLKENHLLSPIVKVVPYILERDAFRTTKLYEWRYVQQVNQHHAEYKKVNDPATKVHVKVRAVQIDKHWDPVKEIPEQAHVEISEKDMNEFIEYLLNKINK